VALGQPGSEAFAGIETFPNPGVSHVEMTSDELTAVCPVTGQPDLYVATIEYWPGRLCIESKSLKLYLNAYRDQGAFAEAPALSMIEIAHRTAGTRRDGFLNAQMMVACGWVASAILAAYPAILNVMSPEDPLFDRLAGTWRIVAASLLAFAVSETVDNSFGAY